MSPASTESGSMMMGGCPAPWAAICPPECQAVWAALPAAACQAAAAPRGFPGSSALIEFRQVCKTYQMGDTDSSGGGPHLHAHRKGGICGYRWPVRLRQIHLHEHHRLPGCAHLRHLSAGRTGRRADGYQSVGSDPQRAAGVHLSAVQPAAQAGPAGKCGGTADVCRRPQGGAPGSGPERYWSR